ncbi:MAG TPA: hypothetical protein VFL85_01200 [Candidatus Saccharimonadales bacterium]|nr:hypothetical protein [Candidatus Saccharimonadales bacterium]
MSIERWVTRGVERLYRMPSDPEGARADIRVSMAARLLCVARTGVEVRDDSIHDMTVGLARVAEEFGIGPDEMQLLLHDHEPDLMKEARYGE